MGKFERMMKRRSKQQSDKDKEKDESVINLKNDKPPEKKRPTWRKDKFGNLIYKNKIRFSYVGIAVMIIVAGGLGLFVYGVFNEYVLTPYFAEDEGVTIIPESDRDFLAPTSAITTERELPP